MPVGLFRDMLVAIIPTETGAASALVMSGAINDNVRTTSVHHLLRRDPQLCPRINFTSLFVGIMRSASLHSLVQAASADAVLARAQQPSCSKPNPPCYTWHRGAQSRRDPQMPARFVWARACCRWSCSIYVSSVCACVCVYVWWVVANLCGCVMLA